MIEKTIARMTDDGKAEFTTKQVAHSLRQLSEHADLFNTEEIKTYIAHSKVLCGAKKGKPTEPSTKNKYVFAYDNFCETANLPFDKPYYTVEEKIPIIPKTESVNNIIANATKKYATIFTILAEIGAEGNELAHVNKSDIDKEQGIISIRGCKGHTSGNYKLKQRTQEMLNLYLAKHQQEYPFPSSKNMGTMWQRARRIAANKLNQPQLTNIPLKNLSNYSGAQLYYKTLDPIAVMRHLRHRKLETTMHYIRGITIGGEEEYVCKAAS
ncbi:site-specific integrase, partial [Candidatus Bathyarchaeota archaeon]|nr:site-specific integrase [Candidatus Bathyarchaeota archaeon]